MAGSINNSAIVILLNESTTAAPQRLFDDIVWTVDFAMLLLALVVAIAWFTYLTCYNARVFGFVITKFAGWFIVDGRFSVNSISISLLSGKVMFAGLLYFHRDFTLRVQYACLKFRYWRPYKSRRLGVDDFSHAEPRLLVELIGLELHVYNRLGRYWALDRIFNLGAFDEKHDTPLVEKRPVGSDEPETAPASAEMLRKQHEKLASWLALIPRTDITVASANFVCGNRTLPSTLVVSLENGKAKYSVKPPSNPLDQFVHTVSGQCENFKITLLKSQDYAGQYEQPPRLMGAGFAVMQTADLQFYYYQEEPGVTPQPSAIPSDTPPPCWGMDLKLGKGTVISYGPWADTQRDRLYSFFFPMDYQYNTPTKPRTAGETRLLPKFDLRVSTLHDCTLDLYFVPNDIPQAIHINFRQGSYCEVSTPMLYEASGFTCTIATQLMFVEASTCLEYRSLLSSETIEMNATLHYPLHWCERAKWQLAFRCCKSTVWLLFEHKNFIQNLINEWSSNEPPDLCKFSPYTYSFDFVFDDVEAVLALNPHNWIDTSSTHEENSRAAVCARNLRISYELPFGDFMPNVTDFRFSFAGEHLNLKMFTSKQNLFAQPLNELHKMQQQNAGSVRWKGVATRDDRWIDCWYAQKGAVVLRYALHPTPVRPAWLIKESANRRKLSLTSFTPTSLDPDEISVDIELKPCLVQFSGALVQFILALKENYFGEAQKVLALEKFGNEVVEKLDTTSTDVNNAAFDERKFRPLDVKVSLILRDVEAQLLTFNVDSNDRAPIGRTENLVFEMHREHLETKLQVCVSPVCVTFADTSKPDSSSAHEYSLLLSTFQLRGHGMYSFEGLPLDAPTIEYGWLMEFMLGDLLGKIGVHQLMQVSRIVENLVFILTNPEEDMPLPDYMNVCQHMRPRKTCQESKNGLCDSEHELKYKMARLSIDNVRLCIADSSTAMELEAWPVRAAFCTEHTASGKAGADLYIPQCSIRQLVKNEPIGNLGQHSEAFLKAGRATYEIDKWLECARFQAKNIKFNVSVPQTDASYYQKRKEFLLLHDQRSRRLTFLHRSAKNDYECGCLGGSIFMGDNVNGIYFKEQAAKEMLGVKRRLAVPHMEPDRSCPGYAQSFLKNKELVVKGPSDFWTPVGSGERTMASSPDFYHEALEKIDQNAVAAKQQPPESDSDFDDDDNSSSASYVSTSSRAEDSAVNLYSQVNRPIVNSALLLTAYGRYLDKYTCREYSKSLAEFGSSSSTAELKLMHFSLERRGLNDLCFPPSTNANKFTDVESHIRTDALKERREQRNLSSQNVDTETISDLQKIDAKISVDERCQIFMSPLGIEILEQQLKQFVDELCKRHPIDWLLDAFHRCSTRQHQQAIVPKETATTSGNGCAEEGHLMRLLVEIPRVDIAVFQCGVIEKIVSCAHLSETPSLTTTSMFIAGLENIFGHLMVRNDVEAKQRVYLANAGFDRWYFHLTQIVEQDAAIIGISQSASTIGEWIPYDSIRLDANRAFRVVMEGKLVFADIFISKTEKYGEKTVQQYYADETMTLKTPSGDVPTIVTPNNENGDGQTSKDNKNRFDGILASAAVHVGLLQPLEQSGDNWPLYDLLAPSASAWLHVIYRSITTLSDALTKASLARNGIFCFLLTEALECEKIFSWPKSKFEKIKHHRKKLNECASCQTLLALLRYCSVNESTGFNHETDLLAELSDQELLRSAAIALLSHWREALCANKLVTLNAKAAKSFIKSPSMDHRSDDDVTVIDMQDGDNRTTLSSPESPSNLPLPTPKSRMESLQNLAAKFDHFAQLDSQNADETQLGKQAKTGDETHVVWRKPSGSGGSDLYEWVKREQESDGRYKKRKQSRHKRASDSDTNPMDVPLYVFFDFLFERLRLRRPKKKSSFFVLLGHEFSVDFYLHRAVATVNEPKYLGVAGATLKRVTYTEKPLITMQELSCCADAKYSEEPAAELALMPLPGAKEDASPPRQAVQAIDYHTNLVTCDVTIGFPSVTFINQLVYVVRATVEAFDELFGKTEIVSCPTELQRCQSLNGNAGTSETTNQQELARSLSINVNAGPTATNNARSTSTSDTAAIKKHRNSQEKYQLAAISAAVLPTHWSKRMLTKLRDFQRAKRSSIRRKAKARSPDSDALLVTTVLGAIDCSKVEINAIFTELFAYATFKSVQLGHKSTESWTVVGPTQLRSSDKSVRGALKQINLTLSEAQSAQAIPISVLTFSIAESHAIFRRYLFRQDWRNSLGAEIGPIHVDIPLNPGSLHGLVVRGTKNISDRLPYLMTPQVVEEVVHIKKAASVGKYTRQFNKFEQLAAVVHFKIDFKEVQMDASLLPSLKASYKILEMVAFGETGSRAKFTVKLPNHEIAFDVKNIVLATPINVAHKILLQFPTIDARGAYIQQMPANKTTDAALRFKEGAYLQIDVDVGDMRRTLTTDLLNQLLFIQEAFTREIGEIIQKIRSEKKPATMWSTSGKKPILYSIDVTINTVQIMATTPTATAVRLDTEKFRFHLSNRLLQKTKGDAYERVFGLAELVVSLTLGHLVRVVSHQEAEPEFQQFGYFKTAVAMRNVASSDGRASDSDAAATAANDTSVSVDCGTTKSTDSAARAADTGSSTYLVTLSKPVVFAQPSAVDKALLLWLSYKNAYEFWNEQRRQIRPKSSAKKFDIRREMSGTVFEQLASPPLLSSGPLFLQVNIENGLYICVPLHGTTQSNVRSIDVSSSALLISLRNTGIAVCNHGALACRGQFDEFGVRFIEDFDGNIESWDPGVLDTVDTATLADMNTCFVPEGTYDICSKTVNPSDESATARWILNIGWKMKGFDMNLNTRIGKLTSLLVTTLTSLAAEGRDSLHSDSSPNLSVSPAATADERLEMDELADEADELANLENMNEKNRKRLLRKTYYALSMKIRQLERQEVDELLIERERRKLMRLEALLFSDSRRDVVTKLRSRAQKATTSWIDQWGLTVKPPTDELQQQKSRRKQSEFDAQQQQHVGRRFSEFRTQDKLQRQLRTGSIDAGEALPRNQRRASSSSTPSEPTNENVSLLDSGNVRRSRSPYEKERQLSDGDERISFDTGNIRPQAIDLYLDLKIYVEDGQCSFRTTSSAAGVATKISGEHLQDIASVTPRKNEKDSKQRRRKSSGKSDRIRGYAHAFPATPMTTTRIFLPGVSVKAYYGSSSASPAHQMFMTRISESENIDILSNHVTGKHGQLIMLLSLENMPEETVISPHILDFFEQVLEPISNSTVSTMEYVPGTYEGVGAQPTPRNSADGRAFDVSTTAIDSLALDASTLATMASFPLDVVLHVNVQSSQIRFTSQPVAQIECILRLPQLQLVATSRTCSEFVVEGRGLAANGVQGLRHNASTASHLRVKDDAHDELSGGIFVTILLSGFSVSLFHMFSAGARMPTSTEKRDALSINMDTVAINLSRSRSASNDESRVLASIATRMRAGTDASGGSAQQRRTSVKVSLVVNMGKAQFKYDMRRLHEILQFPKAWYRRTIFRRLFLGDDTATTSRFMSTPSINSSTNVSTTVGATTDINARDERLAARVTPIKTSSTSSSISCSSNEISDEDEEENENEDQKDKKWTQNKQNKRNGTIYSNDEDDEDEHLLLNLRSLKKTSRSAAGGGAVWEALVLFALNFQELSIEAMMGQVMGETRWILSGVDLQGHFALNNDKNRSVLTVFRLDKSELTARQGQVSGLLNLSALEISAFVRTSIDRTPQIVMRTSLACADIRIDWMSAPTLMGRLTQLNAAFHDEWKTSSPFGNGETRSDVSQESVILLGNMSWESFRILITQTTVTDVFRICYKIKEFIDQSLQSGRMVLFFHTAVPATQCRDAPSSSVTAATEKSATTEETEDGAKPGVNQQTVVKRYHRHWQKALALVTCLQLESSDFFPVPKNATILGGSIEFSGGDLGLACFGTNFHSKEWVIFHLRDPYVDFSTEAKDIRLDNQLAQLTNQELCFRLGQRQMRRINSHMGAVLCVTGAYAATHSSGIDEWLDHAFTSVLQRVYKLPGPVTYKHQYKEAFYVPPFTMHAKTKQIQMDQHISGDEEAPVPVVESSVIADFEDHVKITVQEVLFLRRFIRAYLARQGEASAASTDRSKPQIADPTQELQKDAREYRTINWHVEPTIRLMNLESMETTDYLWQILGIYQYAVTVSKWVQRGFMDPLDAITASLMEQILIAAKKSRQHN